MPRVRKGQTGSSSEVDTAIADVLGDEADGAVAEQPMSGQMITVTWGEEVLQPIQYNGFRIGPITLSTPVKEGETVEQAYSRVWAMLAKLGERQFTDKLDTFKNHLREGAASVRRKD